MFFNLFFFIQAHNHIRHKGILAQAIVRELQLWSSTVLSSGSVWCWQSANASFISCCTCTSSRPEWLSAKCKWKKTKLSKKIWDRRLKCWAIRSKNREKEKQSEFVNEQVWTRQKVIKFDPPQFSADRAVGGGGLWPRPYGMALCARWLRLCKSRRHCPTLLLWHNLDSGILTKNTVTVGLSMVFCLCLCSYASLASFLQVTAMQMQCLYLYQRYVCKMLCAFTLVSILHNPFFTGKLVSKNHLQGLLWFCLPSTLFIWAPKAKLWDCSQDLLAQPMPQITMQTKGNLCLNQVTTHNKPTKQAQPSS